jgi:hypothetical protein
MTAEIPEHRKPWAIYATSEIHKDWLPAICARLRDPMPL